MRKQFSFYMYITCITLIVLLQTHERLNACATPVFRFAIEKWPADFYYATIIHDGPLSTENEMVINKLKAQVRNTNNPLNLHVNVLNIAGPQIVDYSEMLQGVTKEELPSILLFYPQNKVISTASFWHGPVNTESVDLILNSPARQQIVKQLIAGDVAAWVILKTDDEAKNIQTINTFASTLEVVQKEMIEKDKLDAIPFLSGKEAFAFSIIPVSRKDKAESVFIAMLSKMNPNKIIDPTLPIAFPIFGQGRTLDGHQKKDLLTGPIRETCTFLCGECSCMIKAQNPGFDMMLAANWEKALENIPPEEEKEPPTLTGINMNEKSEKKPNATTTESNTKSSIPFAQIIVLTLAGIGGVIFAISGALYFKK